ncbi:BMC domain-containing protein [Tessaracoccus sp. OH4464_COT-324]|uniref:BMC domain-containing protein n=1 Tax=Tessaracoccus sp. OH4464_COT-324 TaxID=2491059 RepID=UPI000F634043|nr:BMC domain-containing protein [Tessaracoccus sp. OH4464_COT-324]
MQALGTVETVGLVAAIEAADVACKTANVELVGYELAKGGGYVTIKVLGQVGAVQAAVIAACTAASRISRVVSHHVIPRPNEQIESLVHNNSTVGYRPPKPVERPKKTAPPAKEANPDLTKKSAETESPAPRAAQHPTPKITAAPAAAMATTAKTTTSRRKQA